MTPEQEEFARLWKEGVSVREICRRLHVCDKTLATWRSRLGLEPRTPRYDWTPDDDAQLARLTADGVSLEKIAEIMGRGEDSLIRRRHRLGIGKVDRQRIFTDAELAELRQLLAKRTPLQSLCAHFRCGATTLARNMLENGLDATGDPGRTKDIPPAQMDAFRAMWHSDMTGAEIAQRMGLNKTTLVWKARQAGWLPKSEIVALLAEPGKRGGDFVSFARAGAGRDPLPAGHPIALAAIRAEYLAGHFAR